MFSHIGNANVSAGVWQNSLIYQREANICNTGGEMNLKTKTLYADTLDELCAIKTDCGMAFDGTQRLKDAVDTMPLLCRWSGYSAQRKVQCSISTSDGTYFRSRLSLKQRFLPSCIILWKNMMKECMPMGGRSDRRYIDICLKI